MMMSDNPTPPRSLRTVRSLFLFLCLILCGVLSARAGDLRITEAYFNPDGDDTGTEWVEIQNTSAAPIDFSVTKYSLAVSRSATDAGWANSVTLSSGILQPGAYAIVGPSTAGNSKPRNGNPAMGNGVGVLYFPLLLNLRNDNGSQRNTGIGLFPGTTVATTDTPISSVFYGVDSSGASASNQQKAKNSSGVVQQVPDFNNSIDTQGFSLGPTATWINDPRGGTPGWGLTENLNGTPSFQARWSTTPTVVVPFGFPAAQGMQQGPSASNAPMTSDYSSLVFNLAGHLAVSIDDEGLMEVTTAGAFVHGSSAGNSTANPLITTQGTNQGYVQNQGDFEGISFDSANGKYYTLNERGADASHASQLYRMDSTFTVEQTFAFTDADLLPVDTERNFGAEAISYLGTFGGKVRLAIGYEGTRALYIYDLDETANTLTRIASLLTGSLYNENPKDMFFDSANNDLYVMNLSGNLQEFSIDPVGGTFGSLLATFRLPEAYRELGPEGMTIGADGTLYIAQDGGQVLAFAAVPEPSTLALLGAGFPALLWWRCARRRTSRG